MFFDVETAQDVLDAFRLLEGKLRDTTRRLSPGAVVIREAASRSLLLRSAQRRRESAVEADDGGVIAELLTLDEVAQRLRTSTSTVRRLTGGKSPTLPPVRIGRAVRVRPVDLQAYIDSLSTSQEDTAA